MKRKFLSLILLFAMTVSLLTVGTGAVEPTYGDTADHWAESSIERWSAYGIIQGSNGLFAPDGQLTCAQLATILAKLLKLPAAKDAGFSDNKADAWYYDAINRCTAAGILNGNGDGTVTPEAPITRERAMVMLARALGIEPLRNPDLTRYTDAAQVSAYARGYVAALIEGGIVGGVTADELAPQDNINRASTVTILDRAISTYADKAGATVKADGKGIVLVVAENVKITGAPEGTKIVVADGATGLTVNGKAVSDDQTYIVPKTTTGSGSSGGYSHTHSYDPTTHKCSCGEVDPAYAVASVSGKNYLTLSEAITAAQSGNKPVTLAASKTTTETIQEILDGQYGSIDSLTIELPTGNYGQLELGRATKYAGSNTEYYVGGFDESAASYQEFNSAEALKTYKNGGGWTPLCYYVRNMSDVTLKAADGATVNVAGVKMTSGHMYGSSGAPNYDYVLDRKVFSTNDSYYLAQTVSNITFVGLNFTAKSDINTSNEETVINGFTFKNCTFNINNTADGNQAIRYYNENNNGKVSNLVVDNCKFNNCFQGVYTSHIKNVIVTNSEFDTTGHNAIAIQDFKGACDHGKVIITGNTFKNIGDRIIRFGNVGADTQITITYNTATNSGDESDEVIKITSLAQGATCDIHDNSWGDGKKVNIPDSRVEMQAQIGEAQYATLAAALAAAKDGDTVKLVADVTLAARVDVALTGTIDLNGHTIRSTATCANGSVFNVTSGTVTIKNGSIVGVAGPTGWTEELYKMECDAITVCRSAIVNLEELNISICSRTGACVYAFDGGTANVKSGTYSNNTTEFDANGTTKAMLLNQVDSKPQAIFVTGGQFHGENPANGDNSRNPSTFLAPDYKSVETPAGSGVWTVSKMTWNEYPEDASVVPSGLVIQEYTNVDFNSNNGNTGTITIKDKDALLYFAYKLNPAAAHEACLKDHSHWGHTCIWYGGACARHIVLNADIDLENITLENGFGNMKDFDFDGQGHKISNVTINYTGTGNTGLFVGGNRGISSLVVENVNVIAPNGTENAVGIVSSDANALITNVTVRNSSVTGGKYTGAIVGYNYGSVTNCKVENCTVSGRYKVGGIIGYICNSNDVPTYVTGNVLTGVTVKGENLVEGKPNFVIGKIVGNWNATVGECSGNTFSGTTVATGDIGKIESGRTVNGVTYVTVTPSTIPSPFRANTTYLFTAGNYGEQHFVITDKENVTLIGQPGAEFDSLQISSIDYVNSEHNQAVDLDNSTLTVKGFEVTNVLEIVVSDKNVVAEENKAGSIKIKTNVSCDNIVVKNNALTGGDLGDSSATKYGVYIVPNISDYDLTITGNTFENIVKHAIGVQGCGDGSAVTAAKSITVDGNQFNSYGTDQDSRAAFKIWEDTKLAPTKNGELTEAAKALAASVQAKNIFAATLDGSCILADFYGKTVPFSPTSPM